ncbi:hypothetical protein SynA15127_01483 [Synechococcus sp. A15-127]|uniref:hypothetical protein n=1 Tax=Synechococcus sp. A15-127 TaxID=1050624 RepID=UPI00164789C0|nr:hypothetical protein [Synechococcus sp. A15-127]QNI94562.1 hypothetical protein SynA15127_01483 [Synechococcus sp. A15-127]
MTSVQLLATFSTKSQDLREQADQSRSRKIMKFLICGQQSIHLTAQNIKLRSFQPTGNLLDHHGIRHVHQ